MHAVRNIGGVQYKFEVSILRGPLQNKCPTPDLSARNTLSAWNLGDKALGTNDITGVVGLLEGSCRTINLAMLAVDAIRAT